MMERWLDSVYSDGSAAFVSNPSPALFETVTVRLRMRRDAPVRHVFLRADCNGEERLTELQEEGVLHGLKYFSCPLYINQPRLRYRFYLVCPEQIYFYNQRGITTTQPELSYDFVLLTDYVQPAWVREAVFYQIFPDRFCDGDPGTDVRDGEYSQDGHPAIHVQDWNAPPKPYDQSFCMDFYGGDLRGIREKIPYFQELGVTALYLNPIFAAPSVHKYDCIDYYHVDSHLGGDEALAELSAALHAAGMKLVLDISINHTGVNHRWFNRDGAFFDRSQGAYHNPDSRERGYYFFRPDGSFRCWAGVSTLPTLNYTSEALRDAVYRAEDSVLKKWLKPPYSIDGWRFDVADTFARSDEVQLAHSIWPEIRSSIRAENPQAYILAEHWDDCAEYLQGTEWDAPMNYYGCGRVIRQFLGETDHFFQSEPALRNVPGRLSAEDVKRRVVRHLGQIPFALWENQFNLFDSHDITRLHTNPDIHPEEYRGAVMFQFILPGAASVYYGDEAGIGGEPGSNEGCRWPMPWDRIDRDGEAWRLVHTLCRLKREHPALSRGGMKFLYARKGTVAIARFWEEDIFVAVLSVNAAERVVFLPLGDVGAARPVAAEDEFGRELAFLPAEGGIHLRLPPHAAYFFRCLPAE